MPFFIAGLWQKAWIMLVALADFVKGLVFLSIDISVCFDGLDMAFPQ
jgi:hypothetical protein